MKCIGVYSKRIVTKQIKLIFKNTPDEIIFIPILITICHFLSIITLKL